VLQCRLFAKLLAVENALSFGSLPKKLLGLPLCSIARLNNPFVKGDKTRAPIDIPPIF
jgi:hypothetical protein